VVGEAVRDVHIPDQGPVQDAVIKGAFKVLQSFAGVQEGTEAKRNTPPALAAPEEGRIAQNARVSDMPVTPPAPQAPKATFASRLFGYDVFISFALGAPPRGSQSYASDLARRLRERDLSVFFSEEEAPPGSPLSETLTRALLRSRLLVVIVNRGTLEAPRWVRTEVETFRVRCPGRPVVPVCLDGSFGDAALSEAVQPWLQYAGHIWLDEAADAAARGLATDALVTRLMTAPHRLRANRLWRTLVGAVGVGLAALTALAAWQAVLATRERDRALSRQLAAQSVATRVSDPVRSLLLAAQAQAIVPTTASDSALLGALAALPLTRLHQHGAAFVALAIRPGGDTLLASDLRGAVLKGEVGHPGLDAVVSAEQGLALFRGVHAFAFSPDGQAWAEAGVKPVIVLHSGPSPHEIPNGNRVGEMDPSLMILGLAFSPDGKTLASASTNGTLLLHDLSGAASPRQLAVSPHDLAAVAFSPDGRWIAAGGDAGWLQAVPVAAGAPVPKLAAEPLGAVHTLVFADAGRRLFAASRGGRLEMFDIRDGRRIAFEDMLEQGALETMAVSPDGRFIATGHANGAVLLWIPQDGQAWARRVLLRHAAAVRGLAFAGDGRTLVSAGADGRLFVTLPVDRGRWLPRPGPGLAKDPPLNVDVTETRSPDGRWIAWSGSATSKASPFEVDLGGLELTRRPRLTVLRGDDRRTVVDGADLPGEPGERIDSVPVFAADASRLAVQVGERLVLWDLPAAEPLEATLPLPPGTRLIGAAPDGAGWLAGTDAKATGHFAFGVDRAAWVKAACTLASRVLTPEEWRLYVGSGRAYAPACL
jgi:hypothetical protein